MRHARWRASRPSNSDSVPWRPTSRLFHTKQRAVVVFAALTVLAVFVYGCLFFTLVGSSSALRGRCTSGWSIGSAIGSSPLQLQRSMKPTLRCTDVSDIYANLVADPFVVHAQPSRDSHHRRRIASTPSNGAGGTNVVDGNGGWYMFFEAEQRLDNITGHGVISVAWSPRLTPSLMEWHYLSVVLRESVHLSYPFVITHGDQHFLVPESWPLNQIRLYRAVNFPYEWEFVRPLLSGKMFVDTSFLLVNGKWYMWTYVVDRTHLYVSDTDDLTTCMWTEHPSSPLYFNDAAHYRSGGRPIIISSDPNEESNSAIIRFVQEGRDRYGGGIHVMRVTTLNETHYAEEDSGVEYMPDPRVPWRSRGFHHVDCVDTWRLPEGHPDRAVDSWHRFVAVVDGADR